MLIDNTDAVGQPGAYLRSHGLGAYLGAAGDVQSFDLSNPTIAVDPTSLPPTDPNAPTDWSTIATGVNTSLLYLTNLARQAQGLPPLTAAQVAPQVNVGLSADTKNTVLLIGAGILAVFLFARR